MTGMFGNQHGGVFSNRYLYAPHEFLLHTVFSNHLLPFITLCTYVQRSYVFVESVCVCMYVCMCVAKNWALPLENLLLIVFSH